METGKVVTPAYCQDRLQEFRELLRNAKRSEDQELLSYIIGAWEYAAHVLDERLQRKGIYAYVPASEPALPGSPPAEHPLQIAGG